jgi:hypothetical protein
MQPYYEFIIGGLAVYSLMAAWQLHKQNNATKQAQKQTSKQKHPTHQTHNYD